jgi:hypothetical protein
MIENLCDQQPRLTRKEQDFIFSLRGIFRQNEFTQLTVRQLDWLTALFERYCSGTTLRASSRTSLGTSGRKGMEAMLARLNRSRDRGEDDE